ncbi:MAG TPA: peptidoglycan-associated lipoprotein Pal [Hydrogenophaga sp.]|uniref:peptidoglycan-associated lipoprotein Pal n=1 Tax=Hydrogenophaga sp. TaxID=1904254 RepID=UPI002C391102|nr:peptidoglycan-associated lipoprotein Pal [Hydrogenophaga sp.]HMN92408.1 peptidoglycan-associated lipoprotein Pal [Hydrogenophaga sp.]HMP10180.1 peptidoglycan-associated lipoprotein Pal [Hydrogenophaga sp.]
MSNVTRPLPTDLKTPRSARWLQIAGAVLIATALGACSSGVRLDGAQVEDRATQTGQAGQGSGADARAVASVDVPSSADPAAMAGLARIVYFDFDSYVVRSDATSTLEANARVLNADRSRRVALEGHTDERGSREYNLALGQRRAEAVRRSLSLLGVSDAQMEAVSFGKERLAAAGFDEAAHAQNRRVEISYR